MGRKGYEMEKQLAELLEQAKENPMTIEQAEEQRLSFAFGNTNIENSLITKETISTAATKLASKHDD